MPQPSTIHAVPRRVLPVFYVLDTSGSMEGEKIDQLNYAMRSTTNALKQVAKSNGDAQIKVCVLEFNSIVRWLQPAGPEAMEDFEWIELEAGGMTYMGAALKELNSKLHTSEFLASATGSLIPVIIFMTDGFKTDVGEDYERALVEIRQNRWYAHAVKVGFAIGDDADAQMIAQVVGDPEAVVQTSDLGLFARLIRFVSVTSSMAVSQRDTGGNGELNGGSILREVIQQEPDIVDNIIPDLPDDFDILVPSGMSLPDDDPWVTRVVDTSGNVNWDPDSFGVNSGW